VLLRLIRRGNTFRAEYSTDLGRTFGVVAPPITLDRPLERRLYVGLVIASYDRSKEAQASFAIPEITRP
jgi:hypothetical protein